MTQFFLNFFTNMLVGTIALTTIVFVILGLAYGANLALPWVGVVLAICALLVLFVLVGSELRLIWETIRRKTGSH